VTAAHDDRGTILLPPETTRPIGTVGRAAPSANLLVERRGPPPTQRSRFGWVYAPRRPGTGGIEG
jgi:hypothetical protein